MAAPQLSEVERRVAFGGTQLVFEHRSAVLDCTMRFAAFLPPSATPGSAGPFWPCS